MHSFMTEPFGAVIKEYNYPLPYIMCVNTCGKEKRASPFAMPLEFHLDFYGDNTLDKNIIQSFPPNFIPLSYAHGYGSFL